MASDFNLSLREQLYVLPGTELVAKDEKDILLEFKRIQYSIFFKKESMISNFRKNGTLQPSKNNYVDSILKNGKVRNVTFEMAATNLLDQITKLQIKNPSKKLEKRTENLKNMIRSSSFSDCTVMTRTDYNGFNEKEKQLNTICVYIDMSLPLDMRPLSEVAEIIDVNADTIRQACQDGRIIARKFKNGWSVSLDECREYWDKSEDR